MTHSFHSLGSSRRERLERLGRWDPVGPVVAGHAVLLALLGSVQQPVGVLLLAAGVLVWRGVSTMLATRDSRASGERLRIVRAVGSVVLVGAMMALDGGTESPLFFSMLVVVVWAAAMNPLRRFIVVGVGSLAVYVGVILAAADVTVASVARFFIFVVFIGLLAWARALSDHWVRQSHATKALAAEILEQAPTAFVLFDSPSLACRFANTVAKDLGLGNARAVRLSRFGLANGKITLAELLASVETSGEMLSPTLYLASMGQAQERFLRIGVTQHSVTDGESLLMVCAEDVTAQVAAGEQQRRFLETANHQFRTPLSPIMTYSALIADGKLAGDELQEAGRAIGDGARRIETLLERISALLRLQRRSSRTLRTVTIADLVEEYLFDVAPHLRDVVHLEDGADLPVRCEPDPLVGALLELVTNGLQHGVPPIIVAAKDEDDVVCVRIYDEGPGPAIDPDTPLDQTWGQLAHPAVMPPEMGQRLGISYAYTLTRTAGGTLRFQTDGSAWAFVFEFPLAPPTATLTRVGAERTTF